MMMINQSRFFWGWLTDTVEWLSIPFFFLWQGMGGGWKKLWERAWDDGLTGDFGCWERPLL